MISFHCGYNTAYRQSLEICGSKKSILIDDFVIPTGGRSKYTLSSSGLTNYAALTFHERDVVECDDGPVQVSLTTMELGRLFLFLLLNIALISTGK